MTPTLHTHPLASPLLTYGTPSASRWGMARTNRISAAALLGTHRDETKVTGWVLPTGAFAPNAYGEHLTAAAAMGCANPEAAGWVHVSAGIALAGDRRPTRRQIDTILDLVGAGRIELPGFLAAQAA